METTLDRLIKSICAQYAANLVLRTAYTRHLAEEVNPNNWNYYAGKLSGIDMVLSDLRCLAVDHGFIDQLVDFCKSVNVEG